MHTDDPQFDYMAGELGESYDFPHPQNGFVDITSAMAHYAKNYFGQPICNIEWKTREDWKLDGPYAAYATVSATVFAGSACIEHLPHPVYLSRNYPLSCPSGFEVIIQGDKSAYCRGEDWLDIDQNLGKPEECAGNPCNVATGNKFQAEIDFIVPGLGGLQFARYYNSDANSMVGGWTHTYSRRIEYKEFEPGLYSAKVYRHDGKVLHFYVSREGSFRNYHWIEWLAPYEAGWKFFAADGSVELYNASGQLISITDRNGWEQRLSYTGTALTVTDAYGRTITLDNATQPNTVTDPAGSIYQYKYGLSRKIETATYPGGVSRRYLYNEPAHTSGANLPQALTGLIDENGARYATWKYNSAGRAISSEHAGGAERVQLRYVLNEIGNPIMTEVRDSLGGSRNYSLEIFDGRALPKGWTGTCSDCLNNASDRHYDGYGNVEEVTDQNGNVTQYVFDRAQHLELSRNESGRLIETQWHPVYRLPILVTELQRVTKYTYSDQNALLLEKQITDRLTEKTRVWKYMYEGRLLKTVDGPRTDIVDVTQYSYDVKGNLATITDAAGKITKFTSYDANGRLIQMSDPNGLITKFAYDGRGNLKQLTRGTEITTYNYDNASQLKLVTLPTGATFTYTYDDAHRLTDIQTDGGERMHFTLNAIGQHEREEVFDATNVLVQKKSATFTLGGQLHEAIDAYNQRVTQTYDANGNLLSTQDQLNRLVTLHSDAFNRIDEITLADRQSTIRTEFDNNDEVTAVVSPTELRVDYTLDGLGNRQRTDTTDWDAISKQNSFDDAGNMISNVDFRGVTTTYTYDALNRLKKTSAPGATAVTLTYDAGVNGVGHLTGAVDESGTTSLTYFQSGRLAKSTRTVGGRTITTSYRYDTAGRLMEMTYPSGRILKIDNLRGKVTGLSFGSAPVLSGIEYHPFGTAKKWNWGNGKTYARTFNMNGEVEGYDLAGSFKTIRRDEAGRIIAIDDNTNPSLNQGFSYDDLDRLTQYHTGSPLTLERMFTYDGEGNRKSVEVGGKLFSYTYLEGTNLLSTVPGPVAKQWNAADTLVKSITDGKNIFKIDPYRRINGVSNSSTNVTYLRDYLSRRVSKKFANGSTVHYAYDTNDRLIAELDGNGATLVEYVWLDDTPVAVFQQGVVHYVFADHLNTPRAITDTANVVRWTWHSEPFGSAAANANPAGLGAFTFNLRFPGQYLDVESGLHYNYFREYDPQTGRYIQSDPIGLAGGINTYTYVTSNPISYVDPIGLKLKASSAHCKALRNKIKNFQEQLDERWKELGLNRKGLLERVGPGEALADSMRGHRTLINIRDSEMRKWEKKYSDDCEDDDPPQEQSCDTGCAVAATAGTMGAGYIAYRCLRMLPSFAPPLWPTIPANLAIP